MEMVSKLLEEITANTLEIGSWLWVDVLHVNHPHSFYVRPRTYSKYLPLLQSRGEHPDVSEINIGDVFVFKSKLLKCVVRGKVMLCERNGPDATYKMFAIDIGFTEDGVNLNRIWTTLYPLEVPSLVTHCQLADCSPRGETWDFDAIDAMRSYVEGERAKMVVRSKTPDIVVVELYNSRPDDIATLLALTNHSTFGYDNSESSRFYNTEPTGQFYALRDLQVGEVLHVRMQSGILLEQFYVTPMEEYQLYLTDRDNYTSYARSQNEVFMEDLKLNAPIGVFYNKNNKFERGLVKELMPNCNKARVQLVDWGIFIEESVMKMKEVPDWYLRVPMRALCCTLHSSQSFTNNVASLSYPGVEFQMTIKAIGDQDLMCPNVVLISPLKSG